MQTPARLPRLRFIPKHSPCLPARSYLEYAVSVVGGRRDYPSLERVWGRLIPDRRMFPTPTGRHALWFFFDIAQVQAGDEVLVASYNYYVIIRLIAQRGLTPVFVDVEPDTVCLDPADLERKVTPRSRIVVATHMLGNPAQLARLREICDRHGLLLFEDCAHAVGTTVDSGKHAGRTGDGGLFSFGLWKLLSSFGGGMLTLRDDLATGFSPPPHRSARIVSAINTLGRVTTSALMAPGPYGWLVRPLTEIAVHRAEHGKPGLRDLLAPPRDDPSYRFDINFRAPFRPFMTEVHRLQIEQLAAHVARRREIVARVQDGLRKINDVRFLAADRHGRANGSYFMCLVPDPERLRRYLRGLGITTSVHEYLDCSRLPQFSEFAKDCPRARYAAEHLIRLPNFPSLEDRDVDYMVDAIRGYFR